MNPLSAAALRLEPPKSALSYGNLLSSPSPSTCRRPGRGRCRKQLMLRAKLHNNSSATPRIYSGQRKTCQRIHADRKAPRWLQPSPPLKARALWSFAGGRHDLQISRKHFSLPTHRPAAGVTVTPQTLFLLGGYSEASASRNGNVPRSSACVRRALCFQPTLFPKISRSINVPRTKTRIKSCISSLSSPVAVTAHAKRSVRTHKVSVLLEEYCQWCRWGGGTGYQERSAWIRR